jgi:hypothetical protein
MYEGLPIADYDLWSVYDLLTLDRWKVTTTGLVDRTPSHAPTRVLTAAEAVSIPTRFVSKTQRETHEWHLAQNWIHPGCVLCHPDLQAEREAPPEFKEPVNRPREARFTKSLGRTHQVGITYPSHGRRYILFYTRDHAEFELATAIACWLVGRPTRYELWCGRGISACLKEREPEIRARVASRMKELGILESDV